MEQEEEDGAMLSRLGVSSVNPEDFERDILASAFTNGGNEANGNAEEEHIADSSNKELSSGLAEIYKKLRAVEVELDAVASSVDPTKKFARSTDGEDGGSDGDQRDKEDESRSDLTLQQALAVQRLGSLKQTKAKLKKELLNFSKGHSSRWDTNDKLIKDIVKEQKPKRSLREVPESSKPSKRIRKTVQFDDDDDFDAVLNAASVGFVETEKDELVRKGILTPFHKLKGFERSVQGAGSSSQQNSLAQSVARVVQSMSEAAKARPTTKLLDFNSLPKLEAPTHPFQRLRTPLKLSQYLESDGAENADLRRMKKKKRPLPRKKCTKLNSSEHKHSPEKDVKSDIELSSHEEEQEDGNDLDSENPFVTLEGGLNIPNTIYDKLFDYQKVGVQWLWELHCQRAGGVIGDEMGLGKTIQVLSFLGALHFSNKYKPSIIICPVTLLRQWKREAEKWYPSFHVELLHDSAQEPTVRKKSSHQSDEFDSEDLDSDEERRSTFPRNSTKKWDSLINRVLKSESGLLITTYEQLRILGEKLLDVEWGYAVLDEGHRIRNPNAEVTLICKQLQTVHRIIMTGAPIQNKLSELWSLFDFVFPGKLGVLPVFEAEFAVPISVGGYANASPLQVSTAYRCAVVLRDLIMPYLLRRVKADLNAPLPKKSEHVLFCSLTTEQRSMYRAFLASSEVEQIFDGNRNSLYGIDVMRKICNHPDLLEREHSSQNPDYGNLERSGKMLVVAQVLKMWKEQGHRVLLFSQTQQMLNILENFMISNNYTYRRMDGLTPVKQRMDLIDEFNNSNDVFIFILTTKVGGLGTNLTGANRVVIFDPDWNPSTDMQARERAWRIGQTRDVVVYRLITRGTIEEKVYQRQIYKHFLTNKILKNPQQKRFFKARDMKDLFTLNDDDQGAGSTETSNIFSQLPGDVSIVQGNKNNQEQEEKEKLLESSLDESKDSDIHEGRRPAKMKGKEKTDDNNNHGGEDEDTNILRSLFGANGIHSAVNHDMIVNANDEEKMRVEEQASQVAQRAAEALRESRMLRSRVSISVPTWTGKSGAAGAPSSIQQRKFGSSVNSHLVKNKPEEGSSTNGVSAGALAGKALTSTELLSRIRKNQEKAISDGVSASSSSSRSMQPEVLIRQICTFLQRSGGRAKSSVIVEHFKDRVPPADLTLFKNLLKEIAILEKEPGGSSWVLKPDYHQQ
ncbi:protein CHROMATIN REMODELING 8 isoform X2 [Impatiens glandulifera]|uniref:protein CHROMATIN REMODELING 8 isoform X2 n=1 Tax=Impatiens glandulifera TaxID=253017 RepID=UPI001FB0BD54|nr:protein CHROMATIN REMODELING 8 isoform X2 [Impatiens glandulifera]